MTQTIRFPGWRDENRHRKYPFADTATLVSGSGRVLPIDFFLDARLYAVGGGPRQYLSSIVVEDSSLTFTFSDSGSALCSGGYLAEDPQPEIWLYDSAGRPAGVLVCNPDQAGELLGWPVGTYAFIEAAAAMASTTIVPSAVNGVSALVTETGAAFFSDVWLVGGAGVVLREEGAGIVRVDIVGDPYYARTACEAAGTPVTPSRFLKTINGMPPDIHGNFTFAVGSAREDNVVRIESDANGLHLFLAGAV